MPGVLWYYLYDRHYDIWEYNQREAQYLKQCNGYKCFVCCQDVASKNIDREGCQGYLKQEDSLLKYQIIKTFYQHTQYAMSVKSRRPQRALLMVNLNDWNKQIKTP